MNLKRRYAKEEFAQRGNKIYQESVRWVVEDGNKGRIVAIDIESGAYEIDDVLAATRRLYARCPAVPRGVEVEDADGWVSREYHPMRCPVFTVGRDRSQDQGVELVLYSSALYVRSFSIITNSPIIFRSMLSSRPSTSRAQRRSSLV